MMATLAPTVSRSKPRSGRSRGAANRARGNPGVWFVALFLI